MGNIISIRNLSKAYGPIQALQNVSFDVPEGSIFGILGPNGSGKTTLLGILLEVLNADSGSYQWFENTMPAEARRQIGSLLETPNFYHYLSGIDNLKIAAAIKKRGYGDYDRVLEKTGLLARKHSAFQTYSLGMKQRLAIAAALLGNPKVLVLDEPTNGLDPAGIAEIRNMILALNAEGTTIIMASHLLDEVEKVCSHVAILKRGELLLHGNVNDVLRSTDQIEVAAADMQQLALILRSMPGISNISPHPNKLLLHCDEAITPQYVNEYCAEHNIMLSHLVLRKKSLESKFIELTNAS